MNNIFKILDQFMYVIRKKYFIKKYGKGVQTINLIKKNIILTIGENHSYTICINEVIDIIYNIDENGYYFRVRDNDRFFFDRKYDIRYRADRDFVSKIKNSNISLTPDFGQYIGIYEWQNEGIIRHCLLNKAFLLTITLEKDSDYIVYLNYGNFNRFNYKITTFENLSISKELKNNSTNINTNTKMHNSSLGFYILDKSLTFNRGYCITPVDLTGCNNSPQVFGDDIFYSFNENEIKTKIIELFDKYNK